MKKFKPYLYFLGILLIMVIFSTATGISTCLSYHVLGIPCPACGLTRAWFSALKGDFHRAFALHPLFLLTLAVPLSLLKIRGNGLNAKQKSNGWIALIAFFIMVWGIRMALLFPNTPPMVFNYDSLLFKIILVFLNAK